MRLRILRCYFSISILILILVHIVASMDQLELPFANNSKLDLLPIVLLALTTADRPLKIFPGIPLTFKPADTTVEQLGEVPGHLLTEVKGAADSLFTDIPVGFQPVSPTNNTNVTEIVEYWSLRIGFTAINSACFAVFSLVNIKTMKLYLDILRRGQPFFGLFLAVQGVCIMDLLVCLTEAISLWVEMPTWVCRAQIGASHAIQLSLSLIICSICIYRYLL